MDKFLDNSEHTGRHIVVGKSGKKYYIEPIGNTHTSFGDINPATKKVEGSYGEKFRGSIDSEESLLTEDNGFKSPVSLPAGVSPYAYIEMLEKMAEQ